MPPLRYRNDRWLTAVFLGFACLCGISHAAPQPAQAEPSKTQSLQLEVFVNDRPAGVIAAFEQAADGRLSSRASELTDVGVRVPAQTPGDASVRLDDLPGVTYVYDAPNQAIRLNVPTDLRLAKEYSLGEKIEDLPLRRGLGAALNYDLFTSALRPVSNSTVTYQGVSATLDGRFFSEFGTFSQSAIVGSSIGTNANVLRLDTAWTYSDPRSLVTYRAGDTISSGLPWTRPVRMGGAQVQRNFGIRPDLVTLPLPIISGSAAVPSTLDVYVNNVKSFSQNVGDGPYRVTSLPLIGDGESRVVLHDAAGHETVQTVPFFTTPLLLRPGLSDYSVEVGVPRNFYGTQSDAYNPKPIVSASLRRGLYDWLTVETHTEAAGNLVNAGIGTSTALFGRGVASVALAGSRSQYGTGLQAYGSVETRIRGISFGMTGQRTFGRYDDLASVTAAHSPRASGLSVAAAGGLDTFAFLTTARPPQELERAYVGVPLPFDPSTLGLAFTRLVNADSTRSQVVSLSWSRLGPFGSSLFLTGYTNIAGQKSSGLFAGLSIALGPKVSASTGVTARAGQMAVSTDVSRSLDSEVGSYGWRVRDLEGSGVVPSRQATAAYRTPWGRLEGTAAQDGQFARGSLDFEGSIAALGGGVYLGNRIDDAFAVVDAKAPNVVVYQDNRPVGTTDRQGKILVPNLRSYQRNTLSIDARNLPVDADAASTQQTVAPVDRSGVLVDFGVKTGVQAAIVVLVGADGKPLPAGAQGTLQPGKDSFVVGYDGRAYVSGLSAHNEVRVGIGLADCTARFDFVAASNAQQVIGPVTCR